MASKLEKLKAGKRNIKVVAFPGTEAKVGIRVLTLQDEQDAAFATEQVFKAEEIVYSSATVEPYEREKTIQLLWRALRDPENPDRPFADTVEELRELMTTEEKDILVDEYMAHQSECSPSLDSITDEEFEGLLEEVKKSPELVSSSSDICLLRRLASTLAVRLATLQTESSST